MGLFLLLIIAVVLVNPESKNADIKLKAEFVITLTWPDESKDDIDLMLKLPNGLVVNFNNKDHTFAALDRDDLGQKSDKIVLPDGEIIIVKENFEHITIRRKMAGEHIVNAVLWAKRDSGPTTANIKVEQLNPYKLIYAKDMVFNETKQEETAVRFTIRNGKVEDVSSMFESVLEFDERP